MGEDEGSRRGSRMNNGCAAEESRSTEMSSLSGNTTANGPRSPRVHGSGPPEDYRLSTTSTSSFSSSSSSFPSPPQTTSPPIPPRSPLRPSARPALGPSAPAPPEQVHNSPDRFDEMPLLHSRSLGSISGLLDHQPLAPSFSRRPTTPDKPLPLTPQPSSAKPLSPDLEDEDDETLTPSMTSASARTSLTAVMTKRDHALQELLSSEQNYASDLALIRDIYIPLALGQPAPFSATPITPPGSSASSSRTLSTASDSSNASGSGPPMTREDAKTIFNNVAELAIFADDFSDALEKALGGVLEGGSGEDCVGQLFLAAIPTLEPLYRTYITKHSTAVEHLQNLPKTPELTAYLAQARGLATGLSHAWDLPSLLIKPVQRLLKYPLLLSTIIEETPDAHLDKHNLRLAREELEKVARGVNEGRRQREAVREVLQGTSSTSTPQKGGEQNKAKKKGLGLGIAAAVKLGRMKGLRSAAFKAKEGAEANAEAEAVKHMGDFLKRYEDFMQRFAKETVQWAESVRKLMVALDEWAHSFGQVIWMDIEPRSEAFDAFLSLISDQLIPICDESKEQIDDGLLPQISALIDTTVAPLCILQAMHTLEPLHYALLNHNVSRGRPTQEDLDASQSYVALRAQLSADLPQYLTLFDRGMSACILRFAHIQQRFFNNIRERWGDLWDALKVDEEANQGAAETLRVWWSRFAEVELQFQGLNIIRPIEKRMIPEKLWPQPQHRLRSSMNDGDATSSVVVSSVLTALDPLSMPHPSPSSSKFGFTTSPVSGGAKPRSVHSMDSENYAVSQRKSQESLHSKKSVKSGKSRRPSTSRGHSMGGSTLVDEPFGYGIAPLTAITPASSKPSYSRTHSMPLSPAPLNKAHSVGRLLDVSDDASPNSSNPSLNSVTGTLQEDARDSRGRPSRKPSFRRRLTDSFRASTSTSDTRHRRSPSLPSYSMPSPSPNKAMFAPPSTVLNLAGSASESEARRRRTSGGYIPAMYECRVIHPCEPPRGVSYRELPFFTLRVDDVYDILQEAGHPSAHRDLPLYVDDGEDCLLLARNEAGDIGWVLASFMLPVD